MPSSVPDPLRPRGDNSHISAGQAPNYLSAPGDMGLLMDLPKTNSKQELPSSQAKISSPNSGSQPFFQSALCSQEPSDTGRWKSVATLTAEVTRAFSDRTAIVEFGRTGGVQRGSQRTIRYADLEARADRIAQALHSMGIEAGDVVALRFQRSIGLVVAALGALKAGAAYLPLNPRSPVSQMNFALDDADAKVILTGAECGRSFDTGSRAVISLDDDGRMQNLSPAPPEPSCVAAQLDAGPEDLAYIIYTSGSTGKPKGVEVTHANLLNLVRWHQGAFKLEPSDRMSLLASVEFDASVWEVWPVLCTGASLYIPDELTKQDPQALRDWMIDEEITISFVPTPMAERLISLPWPHSTRLRTLLTGGDTLHVRPRASTPFRVINNYGPTECTVVATSGPVAPGTSSTALPTIGGAIKNVAIYILDEELRPVGAGQEGEICIGGAGVARGYRNQPEMTREKFVADPFAEMPDARMYRTGDLGRLLPNGEIAFAGRIDRQVKIRGFRIELDAIASVLDEHPWVNQSTVVAREYGAGDKRLVAYVVAEPGSPVTPATLRQHLAARLPEHMIPAIFVAIDALPLNSSGKVDCAALPEPDESNRLPANAYVPPRTATEQRLTDLIAPLLELKRISVEDNFFMLGGHSLLGTQLISRMRAAFGVEIGLRTLFDAPTIAALASEVDHLILTAAMRTADSAAANRNVTLER